MTGLAALAQLLGVLALNNEESKLRMAEEGAIQCLVDILVDGAKYHSQSLIEANSEQKLEHVAFAQEAAAAALASTILHCRPNAKAAVQAGAIAHLVGLLGPLPPNSKQVCNLETPNLLPSAYKLERTKVSFARNKALPSDSDFTLLSECGDSKTNAIIPDEDLIQAESCSGGPLAAMAALGNMVSCYPRCWREIVDAGVASRLANILQGEAVMNGGEVDDEPHQLQEYHVYPTKLQETAALVLDLLIDCEENNC